MLYHAFARGWRRLIGSPKLQIIFHKRAIRYRSLLRKMIYKDKGSYESSPPCRAASSISTRLSSCLWKKVCVRVIYGLIYISPSRLRSSCFHTLRHITTHHNAFPHASLHVQRASERERETEREGKRVRVRRVFSSIFMYGLCIALFLLIFMYHVSIAPSSALLPAYARATLDFEREWVRERARGGTERECVFACVCVRNVFICIYTWFLYRRWPRHFHAHLLTQLAYARVFTYDFPSRLRSLPISENSK